MVPSVCQARERRHRWRGTIRHVVPDIVLDYAFLGAEGEKELVAVLVINRPAHMLVAHLLPRKGLAHENGLARVSPGSSEVGVSRGGTQV